MRTAKYYNNRDIQIEEVPVPEISEDEILIKVIASGICGSDVMEWYRIKKAPLVLGHEIAGDIIKIGKNVKKYKLGDRVFVSHHVPCNTCYYCLRGEHTACDTLHNTNFDPGGFAEYVRIPSINVDRGIFLLPDEVSYEEAVFIEPLACVVRAHRIAQMSPGKSVLVLGSGISGILHISLAKATGAGCITATDINENRLKLARHFGAETIISANEDIPYGVRQANNGRLADLVVVCTGAISAFVQALQSVERGGTVLFFAPTDPGVSLPVPVNDFWRNSIKLVPSYGNSPLDADIAIALIKAKRLPIKEMITHRLPLQDIGLGFKLVSEGNESIKVVIEPNG
ncbi:MAG: alcohol dehydrogenase catalytic domain-containing protein [Candidatus Omnitrophica bacterium]|nr:alcohol dehydrogenase catalytic domain-containing protein [Candidatus Omnitrophota bacterium]MBU1894892.1 alcohol dehydrogenase catalytic domain-containing protein [Candidatus Omnitrophota bacterium]